LGAAQLLFLINMVACVRGGAKVSDKVWENSAAVEGLEFTLPSPPPFHSFTVQPTVK